MGAGRRRSAGRVCGGIGAACALLALAVPVRAQEEDTVPPPEVFRGAASAEVVSVEAQREALLPVENVFRFVALGGNGAYETDNQVARASLFYPGEGVLQGPNLVCGTFGAQFPPEFKPILDACTTYDYPLSVRADASAPSKSTAGAVALGAPTDAVSADAVGATARADADGAHTAAQMSDLRVLGLPGIDAIQLLPLEELELDPSVVRIGSAVSRTDQSIERGVLVVDAEASASDIDLVGGLVHIGSVRSTSRTTDDGKGKRTAAADLEVSGVTVGGVPAQITEDGLVIGSPAGGLGPLKQQLQNAVNQLVEALGVRITLLGTEETLDDGTGLARATAEGLLIEISMNADGLPSVPGPLGDIDLSGTYVGSLQLGNSGAAAGAANFDDEVPTDMVADVPFDSGDGGVLDGSITGDVPVLDVPVADPAPEQAAAPVAEDGPALIRRITDPFGGRIGLLYLAFMFCVLGLCVAPRFTLTPRLPGPRP